MKNRRIEYIIDSNLATVNYPAGKAPGSVTYMRNFDPERFVLTFRNRDYEINEVVKATTQLSKKIKQWIDISFMNSTGMLNSKDCSGLYR